MIIDKCANPIYVNNTFFNCGKCAYCRKKRKFNWSIRGVLEQFTNKECVFITLTYAPAFLPVNKLTKPMNDKDTCGTLRPEDMTLFWKRLRKWLGPNRPIKFIYCGEYGQDWRPHYHAIIYGISNKDIPKDKLKKIWGMGIVDISNKPFVEKNQIAYVVGYVDKKMNDEDENKLYRENFRIKPFQRMSKGLGAEYAMNMSDNWIKSLKIGYNNSDVAVPRYFIEKQFEKAGRKVKLTNITHYYQLNDDGSRTIVRDDTSIQYKVFKNPFDENTKNILKKLYENQIHNLKLYNQKYNLNKDIYEEQLKKIKNKFKEKIYKIIYEWEEIKNMKDEEIQNLKNKEKWIKLGKEKQKAPEIMLKKDKNLLEQSHLDAINYNNKITEQNTRRGSTFKKNQQIEKILKEYFNLS